MSWTVVYKKRMDLLRRFKPEFDEFTWYLKKIRIIVVESLSEV